MSSQSKKIRVGIIRLDTHGMYYGPLLDDHDPLLLRGPLRKRSECHESFQSGGTHYYFYTLYYDATKMTNPQAEGFEITRIWDEHQDCMEDAAKIFYGRPKICSSYEEVSDDVDLVFVADCNGDGSDHLKLATPSIEKGVPTWIDKPFAYDVKQAQAIVDLANKHKTPILSLSILRMVPQFTQFRNRLAELEVPEFGTINGGGTHMAGHIHAISLAQHLFGSGVESVEAMGQGELAHVLLHYGGKAGKPANGVMLNCDVGTSYHCAFYASAYSKRGAIHSPGIGDFEFPYGALAIIEKAREMVETGKPPVPYEEMVENIAVATAAREAQKTGKVIHVKDVM
jgi:predicted dehydrogenase